MSAAAPPFDFRGWRVVVAGGSKGIGRAIALAFAGTGAAVSVCARGQAALDETAHALAAHGGDVHAQACDLADPAAIRAYVAAAADALGGIDVLVNNASGYGFADDDDGWLAGFQVDLMAAVRASREALPHLGRSPHASILHTSSIAAFHPRRHGAPYAAVKAALSHYASSQALALAGHRIRVNAIAPGSIEFPDGLWDRRRREEPALYAATLAKIPFGRYGTPEEVAHAALFLASPCAGWITGQTLCVDGGQGLSG
ncbi:SDR family NAD(P)-dependent oxidoreductase [Fulvimonas soli]|jgi:3-oxoacyl-[acyl-carrier protein] reductase|uniref:3-oxoacyl-[acyl-carrier protein] reductase n=1 Tax=Fulvimonas soli TaxID=155197 RepID=A0A316IIG5_9GAMM|nr:SDR family NAD(P)-dependent oxidoreductase [Fulvimonas soli]PWK92883.1 3-oxoacyl-[acyl-carrier protein] reductase [Fulvimonas soli]TNY26604.1 3-oxoacyl-ACP reductase [Fulvimonas soli]